MNIQSTYLKILAKKHFARSYSRITNRMLSFYYTFTSAHPLTPRYTTRILAVTLRGCKAWCSCVNISKIFICLSKVGLRRAGDGWSTTYGYHNTAASCRLVFVWFIVFACLILWGLVDFRDDNSFESTCGKCIRCVQICTYAWDRQAWTQGATFCMR